MHYFGFTWIGGGVKKFASMMGSFFMIHHILSGFCMVGYTYVASTPWWWWGGTHIFKMINLFSVNLILYPVMDIQIVKNAV